MKTPSTSWQSEPLSRIFIAVALLLSGCTASAPSATIAVLPPNVIEDDPLSRFPVGALRDFASEPLWTTDALDGYEERYRLTIYSISFYRYQIAVDRKSGGATSSRAKTLYEGDLIADRYVIWRSADNANFMNAISAADLWKTPIERWEPAKRDGTICLDGTSFIVERLDEQGYAISQGNMCDRVPQGFLELHSAMLRIAQLKIPDGA